MTEPLPQPSTRSRLRDSSWFAFGATTMALVLLASAGTAVLIQWGADESGRLPHFALPRTSGPAVHDPVDRPVTVDRVVGTFRFPTPSDVVVVAPSLSDLLAPVRDSVKVPTSQPPADEEPDVGLVPGAPTLPVDPGPQPTPPTIHPPVLPMPNPLPIPLPVPLPLPLPLPPISLPLPGL